jgi:hypothetical protein
VFGTADFQSLVALFIVLGSIVGQGGMAGLRANWDLLGKAFLGDDTLLAAGSPDLKTWLDGPNHVRMAAAMGYTVTSATDKSLPPYFKPWSEVSILKRHFRTIQTPDGPIVSAPREMSSIAKSLFYVGKTPKGAPDYSIMSDVIWDVSREMWLWGFDEFERVRPTIQSWLDRYDDRRRVVPEFADMYKEYKDGTFKTWTSASGL